MNELDEAWSQMMAGAIATARAAGRGDVADYLALKQSNDAIRQTAVEWLFNSVIEIVSEANRDNHSAMTIEREEPHEFDFGPARMAGSLLRVRFGVRNMTVETGWTRTPAHGFMRGGALAAGRIAHFGMAKANVELTLGWEGEVPAWRSVDGVFDSQSLRDHVRILLGN